MKASNGEMAIMAKTGAGQYGWRRRKPSKLGSMKCRNGNGVTKAAMAMK